jgi:hypothetical protein
MKHTQQSLKKKNEKKYAEAKVFQAEEVFSGIHFEQY